MQCRAVDQVGGTRYELYMSYVSVGLTKVAGLLDPTTRAFFTNRIAR